MHVFPFMHGMQYFKVKGVTTGLLDDAIFCVKFIFLTEQCRIAVNMLVSSGKDYRIV